MDENYRLFIELSEIIQAIFKKAIEKAELEPDNFDILRDLAKSPEYQQKIEKLYKKGHSDGLVRVERLFKHTPNIVIPLDGEKLYDHLLPILIAQANDLEKTKQILFIHNQNIELIKKFTNIRLKTLKTIDYRKLPGVSINAQQGGRLHFLRRSRFLHSANDYEAIFSITQALDSIHLSIAFQAIAIDENIAEFVISYMQKLSFIEIESDDVKIINDLEEVYALDIEAVFDYLEKFDRETLLRQSYNPQEKSYYRQGIPTESDDELSVEKPSFSSEQVNAQLKKFLKYNFPEKEYLNPPDATGHLFKLLIHWNNFCTLWEKVPGNTEPHIYYLEKIQQLNRSLTYVSKIITASGMPKNTVIRFLDEGSHKEFYDRFSSDEREYSKEFPFYFNKNAGTHTHLSARLDRFEKKIRASKKFYKDRNLELESMSSSKKTIMKLYMDGKAQESSYINFFGEYILKFSSTLAENFLHCQDHAEKYGVFQDQDEIAEDVSHLMNPKYSDDKKFTKFLKIMQRKAHHVSDQTKFDHIYVFRAFDWYEKVRSSDNKNYTSLDLPHHIERNAKIIDQSSSSGKNAVSKEEAARIKKEYKKLYQEKIEIAKQNLSDPKTMFSDDGIQIDINDESEYENKQRQLLTIVKNRYGLIVKKISKAFDFDAKPYINDLYSSQPGRKNTSELNQLQRQAVTVLMDIAPPISVKDQDEASYRYDFCVLIPMLAAYADMLVDIETNLTDEIVSEMLRSYKSDPRKNKSIYDIVIDAHDDGTQNAIQDVTGDPFAPIDYDFFKKAAVTPAERLKQYNQKIWKQRQEQSKNKFNDLLQLKGKSSLPKQNFIYKPYESREADEVFREIMAKKTLLNQFRFVPLAINEIPTILQAVRAQGNVIQLVVPAEQSQQANFRVVGRDGSVRMTGGGSGGETMPPRGLLKSGPGSHEGRFASALKQLRNLMKVSRNGSIIKGPGFVESTARGTVVQGPGAVAPMPIAGRVAGNYIGVFIVIPEVYTNMKTIVTSDKAEEKTYAIANLGVMAGSMWLFTKFIASKYPKTAAVILVGTAGKHVWGTTTEFYDSLGQGKTKSTIIFLNEKAMLKVGMSCIDGRKPELLNPDASNFSLMKQMKK